MRPTAKIPVGSRRRGFSAIEIVIVTGLAISLVAGALAYAVPLFRVTLPAQALATDLHAIEHQAIRYYEQRQSFRRMALPGESRDNLGYVTGTPTRILPLAVSSGELSSRFTCTADCTANPLGAQYRHYLSWPDSIALEIRLPADGVGGTRRQPVLDRLHWMLERGTSSRMLACRAEDGNDSLLYVRMMRDRAAAAAVRSEYIPHIPPITDPIELVRTWIREDDLEEIFKEDGVWDESEELDEEERRDKALELIENAWVWWLLDVEAWYGRGTPGTQPFGSECDPEW